MKKINLVVLGIISVALITLFPLSSLSGNESSDTVILSRDNTIVLNSEVNGESVSSVISKAKSLDGNVIKNKLGLGDKRPMYLFLNTPGGSIQAGLEMIEALHGMDRPVNTVTLFAASMGFQIAQNLGDRLILKNGVLMSHRARGAFEGEFGGQAPSQIESRYTLWKSRLDELDAITVSRTKGKQTIASYQNQYSSEMWLTGQQSVDRGYADRVVKVKCDSSLSGTTVHEVQTFIGNVKYELDNCPINTSPTNIQVGFFTNKGKLMYSTDFINAGGEFGPTCLTESVTNKDKLCALDTSLNMEKIRELKTKFSDQYEDKKSKVIPMY